MMKFLSVSYSVLVKLEIECFMELLLPMHNLIMICKIFSQFTIFKHLLFLSLQLLLESVFISCWLFSGSSPSELHPRNPHPRHRQWVRPSVSIRSNSSYGSGHHALTDTSGQHLSSLMSSLGSDLGLHVAHGNEAPPPPVSN